jgi:hypothetical protein
MLPILLKSNILYVSGILHQNMKFLFLPHSIQILEFIYVGNLALKKKIQAIGCLNILQNVYVLEQPQNNNKIDSL